MSEAVPKHPQPPQPPPAPWGNHTRIWWKTLRGGDGWVGWLKANQRPLTSGLAGDFCLPYIHIHIH